MITIVKYKSGALAALFAGVQILDREITRKPEFSHRLPNFGSGLRISQDLVVVPWFGHTTLAMTFGYLVCSKYSPPLDFTLNGVILTATYLPLRGGEIRGQSSLRTHGRGYHSR